MGGYQPVQMASPLQAGINGQPGQPTTVGQTGEYLGAQPLGAGAGNQHMPHVIPNPFDNTILIQGTPQEYAQIQSLLRQLDIAPRQVLIDAKIYEVDLKGAFAAGVSAYLEKKNSASGGAAARVLNATSSAAGLTLTTGALVLRSHELLAALTAQETKEYSRVISAPSIIATDSIAASMNVGDEVPVLTSQAVGGVQQGGNSLFTNTVSNRSSGVTLSILARVNSSGVVTMVINQNVSSPQAPAAGSGIQSPSFQNRSFSTQITVQDGDTVAIGGIIQESNLQSSSGVPFLHRLPGVGALFGAQKLYQVPHRAGGVPDAARHLRHQSDRRRHRRNQEQFEEPEEAQQGSVATAHRARGERRRFCYFCRAPQTRLPIRAASVSESVPAQSLVGQGCSLIPPTCFLAQECVFGSSVEFCAGQPMALRTVCAPPTGRWVRASQ